MKGEGVVDESSLTGESLPISKTVHSSVMSGTILQNGYIEGLLIIMIINNLILNIFNRYQ